MNTDVEYIPYGAISSSLTKHRWRTLNRLGHVKGSLKRTKVAPRRVFISFSQDLDKGFVEMFRTKAKEDTRLLIFNEGFSTDRLVSRIVDLQIRTPQRFYVIDTAFGSGKAQHMVFVQSFIKRLTSAFQAEDKHERILDARIKDGVLHVVSPDFNRLDVPVKKLPDFRNADAAQIEQIEIDEDGSFIYWPGLDVQLGWVQLQQCVNPVAMLKASQKSGEFNKRYGKAVQKFREAAGLKPGDISGVSEKQLRRIENGQCRLTSNGIEALSQAHKLEPNEYMKKIADALQ